MIGETFLAKGSRVRVKLFVAQKDLYSIAGAMPKVAAQEVEFSGVLRHVRGNHPIAPTSIKAWVEPDEGAELGDLELEFCEKCGVDEVRVDPAALRSVR